MSSFRHGAPRAVHIARLHASTRSRGANLEPRAEQSTTTPHQSIDRPPMPVFHTRTHRRTRWIDKRKWGSGRERGTRWVTPNRFGRCTSRDRLRQHRLLPPPCVLQSSPSAYPSRDNCRRHGDALLIGTRIIPLGEQIDPRIADRRTWRGQGPFNW